MAIRTPLKLDAGDIKEMDATDITNIKNEMIRQYALSPSVTLAYSAGLGTIGSIDDTRLQAGAYSTNTLTYPTEATTAEPSLVTVSRNNTAETVASLSAPTDTSNRAFPLYQSGGNIYAMSLTDMYDTFVDPVLSTLTTTSTGTAQGGTYAVSTSSSVAGWTLVSGSPIYSDTRANTAAYTAAGIPETLDQPATINNYYLHNIDGASQGTIPTPIYLTGSDQIQEYTTANLQSLLSDAIRYYATQEIRYYIGTSTAYSERGTMVDTRLTGGSGNYQTLFVNANDYRAQEFPDGAASTISTYYFSIRRI